MINLPRKYSIQIPLIRHDWIQIPLILHRIVQSHWLKLILPIQSPIITKKQSKNKKSASKSDEKTKQIREFGGELTPGSYRCIDPLLPHPRRRHRGSPHRLG